MVTLLSLPKCVQCKMSERRLEEKGIDFEKVDMSRDEAAFQKAKDLGYLTAPVIIAPDGSHFSGYDPDRIDALAA